MFRFSVNYSVVLLVVGISLGQPMNCAAEDRPPNIVLVFADDLGINDLACYGRAEHKMPNLDRLASQGMQFDCAYCAQPICSPSRAALMTGKSPARLHLTNFLPGRADADSQRLIQPQIEGQLPLEEVTIAELLRDAGYTTGLFGKWHLGGGRFGPQHQGFDVTFMPPANSVPSDIEGGKSEYAITNAAVEFIETNRDRPFFCYVPHNTPHIPLGAQTPLVEQNQATYHPVYAAMMTTLDDCVGRLMAKVDELELTNETIFIFTSDNGGLHVLEGAATLATHNTPYRAGKGFLYEGGVREPLIVRWPGVVAAGSHCATPVVLTDLVPTLLAAAGVDVSQAIGPLDGTDITEALKGKPIAERQLFWHFPNYTNQGGRPGGAIRDGRWKLIEHFEDGSIELYDLEQDPSETNDLASEQEEIASRLREQLAQWRHRVGAQMPKANPDFDEALHQRLYVTQDSSRLVPEATAVATEPIWREWRTLMNQVTRGRKPITTPYDGDIRLFARDAQVHGERLRYEPEAHKNTLGYWTNADDWAEWELTVPNAGVYEVEVQYGCGANSGGAVCEVQIGDQTLELEVRETGHFQQMIQQTIGTVELSSGAARAVVRARSKPGVAVMDLRRLVLRPVPQG